MARQNVNLGITANNGGGDTARQAGQKINENFIELYTLLGGSGGGVSGAVSLGQTGLVFNGNTYNTELRHTEGSGNLVFTLPTSGGQVISQTANQSMTNKTLTSAVLTTPEIHDASEDHNYVFAVSELTDDRTITLPLLTGDDTLVFEDHTQTISNKTLVSPITQNPTIHGEMLDSNGATILDFSSVASAVNYVTIQNFSTGSGPTLSAQGTDTNVDLRLYGKGDGAVSIETALGFAVETHTTSGAISMNKTVSMFNSGTDITMTLANPSLTQHKGHTKKLVNINSGNITITPAAFNNGTSVVLRNKGAVEMMWIDNSIGWTLLEPFEYGIGDGALWYIT